MQNQNEKHFRVGVGTCSQFHRQRSTFSVDHYKSSPTEYMEWQDRIGFRSY